MASSRWLLAACALSLLPAAAQASWTWADTEIARVGDVAPDTGGSTFWDFGRTRTNEAGDVAFYARVLVPGGALVVHDGIFVREGGSLVKRVVAGDPAPAGLGTFLDLESTSQVPAFNDRGDVAFVAFVSLPGRGVFLATEAGIAPIVMAGDPAPPEVGGTFSFFVYSGMDLSDAGELVFVASVSTPSGFVNGVFRASGGNLSVVAVEGGAAPGGDTYTGFGSPTISPRGDIAFSAATGTGRVVVLASPDGGSRIVATRGDPAPRTGGTLLDFDNRVAIDDAGRVLFRASTPNGEVGHGIFRESAGTLTAVAVPGDPVLGVPNGTVAYLRSPAAPSGAPPAAIPALIDTPAGEALALLVTSNAGLQVARLEGDPAPGGSTYTDFTPQPAVSPSGQVAFTGELADGSAGVFLTTSIASVPALPFAFRAAAAGLLLLTGFAASARRG